MHGLTPNTVQGSAEKAALVLHWESPKAAAGAASRCAMTSALPDRHCLRACRRLRQLWKATPRKMIITVSVIDPLKHYGFRRLEKVLSEITLL